MITVADIRKAIEGLADDDDVCLHVHYSNELSEETMNRPFSCLTPVNTTVVQLELQELDDEEEEWDEDDDEIDEGEEEYDGERDAEPIGFCEDCGCDLFGDGYEFGERLCDQCAWARKGESRP